ncbi:MAG TPA: diacylglycerol kinase family lipid kinase [Candidatus Hydrogenedentes bacterium]|nr:diacylglycerol kinase family lipid kinase [Candidatus Hydrogenedentota bacterium]HRK35665.1 diacylglycerol kinase family lipid kinase [Candidatus Hydrogenedentota bacterium]
MQIRPRTAVIVNPSSANGRTGKRWQEIEQELRAVLRDFSVFSTKRPGHAVELTSNAIRDGFDLIVSVGGDGTHCEVVNGFFDGNLPINPNATMAIFPHGTGSDLARGMGVRNPQDALRMLADCKIAKVDLGRVTLTLPHGGTQVRYFLNIADFGIGGAVAERVNGHTKRLGPFLTFLSAVLRTLLTFKNPMVSIQIDGESFTTRSINVIIANGQYYGGGIHVARDAKMSDGVFEVYVLGDIRLLTALRYLHTFYLGTYTQYPHLARRFKATRVVAQSDERVLLNLDGEQPGQLPAAIELLPAALSFVVPESVHSERGTTFAQ